MSSAWRGCRWPGSSGTSMWCDDAHRPSRAGSAATPGCVCGLRAVLRILGHPWWSLALVAAAAGVALVAADLLREGPPNDPGVALAVVTIFVTVEVAAVFGGFLVFGAYLGLRPPLRRRDASS